LALQEALWPIYQFVILMALTNRNSITRRC
jgi:hypothetical protein